MMKKLLALVVVLAVAGIANAGLQLKMTVNDVIAGNNEVTLNVGDVVMIGIHNGQGDDQYNAALILSGMGEWTGQADLNRLLPQAAGWERIGMVEGMGDMYFAWFAQPVTDKLPEGIIGAVGYKCTGLGDASILMIDDSGNELGTLMIHQIPEPLTFGLLGLGALVLRRRR
jgi:hypothetical protein